MPKFSLSCPFFRCTHSSSTFASDSQSDEEAEASDKLLAVKLHQLAAKNGDEVVPTMVHWMSRNSAPAEGIDRFISQAVYCHPTGANPMHFESFSHPSIAFISLIVCRVLE